MEDWQKSDIAICIKAENSRISQKTSWVPPVRLNAEYIVNNVYKCVRCGSVNLDIGLATQTFSDTLSGTTCGCGEIIPCKEIHWCAHERFKKKIIKPNLDIPFLEEDKQ